MTAATPTPWAEMLRLGLQLGIAPDAFWRLSVREWRMLTDRPDRPGGPTMGRETFERLAGDWPDEEAKT